jgi:hypothetical protein
MHGEEFLVLDERPTRPLSIALPVPLSDDLLIALTERNYEWWPVEFKDGVKRQSGPWRMERSAAGELIVRPKSWLEGGVLSGFSIARSLAKSGAFFTARWGFAPSAEGAEVWEIDSAHASEQTWERIMARHHETKSETESWHIPPDLAINVIDRDDFPVDTHLQRARTMARAGAKVVAVCDLVAETITLIRAGGDERLERPERWSLPEIPGVELPFISLLQKT